LFKSWLYNFNYLTMVESSEKQGSNAEEITAKMEDLSVHNQKPLENEEESVG